MSSYYEELRAVNVSQWVEKKPKKNRKTGETIYLNFLSWANAWDQLKRLQPGANYTVYENVNGWNYHTDGRTAWVKVGVSIPVNLVGTDEETGETITIDKRIEHIETLPVYDFNFNPVPLDQLTSDHVNTAIQRALTKAIARHGLGLSLYAGEDLNDHDDVPFTFQEEQEEPQMHTCKDCGVAITDAEHKYSMKNYGRPLCRICQKG